MSTNAAKKRIRKTPEQRLEALRTQIAKTEKKVREKDRQEDARRKILLGGSLMALARKGDQDAERVLGKIPSVMGEKERSLVAPILAEHRAAGAESNDNDIVHMLARITQRMFGGEGGITVSGQGGLEALLKLKGIVRPDEREHLQAYWAQHGLKQS